MPNPFSGATFSDGGGTHPALNPTRANDGIFTNFTHRDSFAANAGVYTVIWDADMGASKITDEIILVEESGAILIPTNLESVPGAPSGAYREGIAFLGKLNAGDAYTDFTASVTANVVADEYVGARDGYHFTYAARTYRYIRIIMWSQATGATFHNSFGFAEALAEELVLPACSGPVALDIYSLAVNGAVGLTYLATLCGAEEIALRIELDGTGSGTFRINRNDADATAAILGDGDGAVRYVKVRIPGIDANPIFGFFIEEGDFGLLGPAEDADEVLTFRGRGPLAYLDFAVMAALSHIDTPFDGENPFGGLWRLYAAGTGSKPGQILRRVIAEHLAATTDTRTDFPLANVTVDFDYTNDSSAVAWSASNTTDEFAAAINESVLSVVGRLLGTRTLTVTCNPAFLLSGYNIGNYGTNRSSATFAAGKVRFVAGTNIGATPDSPGPKGLAKQVRPGRVATHAVVYGENEGKALGSLADATSRVTRETGLTAFGSDATALDAIGDAFLADQLARSDSISVPLGLLGTDDATGKYLPGPPGSANGKFWIGDTVTLHTGTGAFDHNNASFKIAAINIHQPTNATAATDLNIWVELGSLAILPTLGPGIGGSLVSSPGGGSSSVPAHTHPSIAAATYVREIDGAPNIAAVAIQFPNGSVSDQGSGVARVTLAGLLALDDLSDVVSSGTTEGQVIRLRGATWTPEDLDPHAHVVGEPFVGDAAQTVFYLANEAEADTVAAWDVNGNRVAITQDATELDKVTFTAAPASGQGWLDYTLSVD